MPQRTLRKLLFLFVVLLLPVVWLASRFDPYQVDGDAVAYMDLADLIHAHHWHAVVDSYWHPLYPAFLTLAQVAFHPTRWTELAAYDRINFVIFLLNVVAVCVFVGALTKLRQRFAMGVASESGQPLLSRAGLQMLGLGMLVIASGRELPLGKVGPDALLQALMLGGFAALMYALTAESIAAAAGCALAVGACFGLAYLTKSFAFAIGVLSIVVMVVFGLWLMRRGVKWAAVSAVLALAVFGAIAGPYVAAMTHKYGHLDFGDSGALNYAWYSGNTEKMHLEPWMTDQFGTATVHLVHPEKQLLATPGIYSYKAVPNGTYPDWFDPGWFNDGVKPHVKLRPLIARDKRNVALVVRYLLNHPEPWVLLLLLLAMGAGVRRSSWKAQGFALPMLFLGLAIWAIYGLVNIEERYVTLGYLMLVLAVFALLRDPQITDGENTGWRTLTASAMVALFAFLALGSSLRTSLEERRLQPAGVPAWESPAIFDAAHGLAKLGVKPGDEIACMGVTACLHDHYWARLAGARITTEIYAPEQKNLLEAWEDLPDQQQAVATVKAQGAKVMVAYFAPHDKARRTAEEQGWRELDGTSYWALPLNLTPPAPQPVAPQPWVGHGASNQ